MDGMDNSPSSMIPNFARGLHILLVDHDTTSLMYLASMLEQYSCKVTTTELASVALSMIREQKDRFKLVIANLDMPDMNSVSFLRVLVKKDIPVILMSSRRNVNVARKALDEGASHYFEKPISMDDLKYVWQHVYRKKNVPKKENYKANHGIKENCRRKESQGIEIKEPIGVSKNVAPGNDLQGIELQRTINDPKGNNKQIAVEGCLNQFRTNDLEGKNYQTVVEGFLNDPKGKNKQIVVEGCLSDPKGNNTHIVVEGCLNDHLKEKKDDPKGKNKQTVVEGCLNDPKGKNKQQIVIERCLNDPKANNMHIVVEGCLNDHLKEEDKQKSVEGCLNEESCVKESQNTCNEQMMTKESQKQGGSSTKRSNEDKDGKEDEKKMKMNSEQINSISEKPNEEEGKEWKDYTISSKGRRSRIVWNSELHLKFTSALSALGDKKARPKSILKMMNVPHLTQRQVASHLQKYKSQVKRLCEIGTSSLPTITKLADILNKTGSSQTLGKYNSLVSQAARGNSSIAVGGNITAFISPNSLTSTRLHATNYASNSIPHPQSYHINIHNDVQMANFGACRKMNQINEIGSFPNGINKHENGIKKQPFELGNGNVHMSKLNLPSMTQEVASRVVSVETFQFPNVPHDVHKGLNFAPDLDAPFSSHYWNKVSMASTRTIGGLNIVPGKFTSGNVPNADKVSLKFTDGNQKVNATASLTPAIVPGKFTSGNVPNADKVPSEFTDGNQKVDATASLIPAICSLNQSQPLSKYDDLLKELEQDTEEFKNSGSEVNQGDLDRYYEWLTDALLGDSTNP